MAENTQQQQVAFEQVLKHSQNVKQMLDEFRRNGPDNLAFSCAGSGAAGRISLADALLNRFTKPDTIRQGDTPLCSPAAFLNCVARDRPTEYVRYVLSLACFGKGALGALKVEPGNDCRKAACVIGSGKEKKEIAPVDWIALASLRDSSNTWRDMQSLDSNIAGITLGSSLAAWFQGTGWFHSICNKANGAVSASLEKLLELTPVNGHVCLLICSTIITSSGKKGKEGKSRKTWFGTADHWIVLRGGVKIDHRALPLAKQGDTKEKSLDFPFWHWGYPPVSVSAHNPALTVGQFLPYYYGYVRALKA